MYLYIDNNEKMAKYIRTLRTKRVIALDLEGEFNLHSYGEHLCLLQIFDGELFALIDPFGLDLSLVKEFCENERLQKIMFDCSGDRTLLYRQYNINLKGIVDLFPGMELLEELEKRSLGFALQHFLNITPLDKKKFQQYNWMKRPISQEALLYALEDVKHLFDLQNALMAEIKKRNLTQAYIRKNQEATHRLIPKNSVPGLFKKGQFKKLSPPAQEKMRELYHSRESFAKELNLPPNTVVPNSALFDLVGSKISPSQIPFPNRIKPGVRQRIIQAFEPILKK